MLVIKKVSKEDPSAAFSAGFASAGPLPTNGTKVSISGPSVYKNLLPKPATAPSKVGVAESPAPPYVTSQGQVEGLSLSVPLLTFFMRIECSGKLQYLVLF